MLYINKNKLKSFILAILVISSFVQVGILWDYQSRRFPFSFISNVFSSGKIEDKTDVIEKARKEVYKPYRLTISNGNETHWLIGEDDKIKYELFNEVNQYLKRILSTSEGSSLSENLWPELVVKKSIMIEFRTGFKTNLLKWFLNIRGASGENPNSIQKILMSPDEDINNNNTIYILSSKGLYKYVIPFNKNGILKREYSNIINNLEKNTRIVQYKIFKEIDPNNVISSKLPFSIPKDTLCIVHGTRYFKYHTINYYVKTKTADIEEIAIAILGNEKESFDRYIESNALVFKNINNTYRLYNDGLLEYKYVPGVEDQEKGDIGEAFEKAYFFINRVKNSFIDADDSLYLKNIKDDNPNYYEFIFDYKADELPVYINFDAKGKDKEPLKNALTIKVDSKRIIECRWYIINIEENRTQREYNVYFQDMLDDLSKKYGRQKLGDFNIKNVTRAYLINDNAFNTFSPVWIIENPNEEYYYVELKEKME